MAPTHTQKSDGLTGFCLALAMGLASCQSQQTSTPVEFSKGGLDPVRLTRLSEHFKAQSEKGSRSGYVIMIKSGLGAEYAGAFGMMDIDSGTSMAIDTEFRIASLTKPVISAAIMRLIERGQLRLTDPVMRYLPEFSEMEVVVGVTPDGTLQTEPANRPITLFDLMTHTAGLGASGQAEHVGNNYYAEKYLEFFAQESLADASEWIASLPLLFQPGDGWGYSLSVDVLARIIEVRTEMPIESALNDLVFVPLGMSNTYFNGHGVDRSNVATLYVSSEAGDLESFDNSLIDSIRYPMSGGGLISTARDYMKFLEVMRQRGRIGGAPFLSPASVDAMTRNVLPEAMRPIRLDMNMMGAGFGLGFGVITADQGAQSLLAPGDFFWAGATDTFAFVSPSRNISAVILSQYWANEYTTEWDTPYDFVNMASAAVLQAR